MGKLLGYLKQMMIYFCRLILTLINIGEIFKLCLLSEIKANFRVEFINRFIDFLPLQRAIIKNNLMRIFSSLNMKFIDI